MADSLPQYDNPPVIETVLGLEFRPIPKWGIPYFGLFWEKINKNYPQYSIQQPLPDESFGSGFVLSFNQAPMVRCWFHDDNDQWLLQVQNSRVISNWRKRNNSDYPSYKLFRDRFVENFELFNDFVNEKEFSEPHFFQAEVSYINRIEAETDLSQLPELFPVFAGFPAEGFLPVPQSGGFNFVYSMPDERGRLFIKIDRMLDLETNKEFLQFTVTAKTLIASNTKEAAFEALDFSHEWVVRGFTDFTSAKMHEDWERKS